MPRGMVPRPRIGNVGKTCNVAVGPCATEPPVIHFAMWTSWVFYSCSWVAVSLKALVVCPCTRVQWPYVLGGDRLALRLYAQCFAGLVPRVLMSLFAYLLLTNWRWWPYCLPLCRVNYKIRIIQGYQSSCPLWFAYIYMAENVQSILS